MLHYPCILGGPLPLKALFRRPIGDLRGKGYVTILPTCGSPRRQGLSANTTPNTYFRVSVGKWSKGDSHKGLPNCVGQPIEARKAATNTHIRVDTKHETL